MKFLSPAGDSIFDFDTTGLEMVSPVICTHPSFAGVMLQKIMKAWQAAYQILMKDLSGHAESTCLCAVQALKRSALVIAGFNTAGFAITAVTRSHKITDLTVRSWHQLQ
jgi:hypothetical protein